MIIHIFNNKVNLRKFVAARKSEGGGAVPPLKLHAFNIILNVWIWNNSTKIVLKHYILLRRDKLTIVLT